MLLTGWYLLKVMACSGILLGYYWWMLRNKLYHQYNRFFLLVSVVLSLALPLFTIHIPHYVEAPSTDFIPLLQAVEGDALPPELSGAALPTDSGFAWHLLPVIAYALVSLVMLVLFIRVLWYIRSLIHKYKGRIVERFFFVSTRAKNTPFSFFNYIFWNEDIDLDSPAGQQIFRHEVAHVQERHSHDKLLMNLLLIVFWSNPFFWLIRKELSMIHEFIADKRAVEDSDTASFAAMILQAAYPQHRFDMVNPFFYSPIKRRLLMLTKKQSPRVSYLSRILVLPLAVLVFAAFTFKAKPIYEMPDVVGTGTGETFTVVLDAGHGGLDAGAYGPGGEREKDLTLAIAQQVQRLNSANNIRFVLSRQSDVLLSPIDRVQFCKDQGADLFISLHLDAAQRNATAHSGLRVLVGKEGSTHVQASKLLASGLIGNFRQQFGLAVHPQPVQQQQGVMVLDRNNCPAVLIEAGFMSNAKDLAYLKTDAAQKAIAQHIIAAVNRYLTQPVPAAQPTDRQTATADTMPPPKVTVAVRRPQPANGAVTDLDSVSTADLSAIFDSIKPADIAAITMTTVGKKRSAVLTKRNGQTVNIPTKSLPVLSVKTDNYTMNNITTPGGGSVRIDTKLQPLYVLNGQVLDNNDGVLTRLLNTNSIKEINVLKNEKAITYYGEKGRNGVIEIITKDAQPATPAISSLSNKATTSPLNMKVLPEVVAVGYKKAQASDANAAIAKVQSTEAIPEVVVVGRMKIRSDKDNPPILYIGMPNKIQISSGGKPVERLRFRISEGGTFSIEKGEYIIRCSRPGTVTLYISDADGKLLEERTFKVERLPDPSTTK
jgi:N-acetylmuramoyl-L-alanine amidase